MTYHLMQLKFSKNQLNKSLTVNGIYLMYSKQYNFTQQLFTAKKFIVKSNKQWEPISQTLVNSWCLYVIETSYSDRYNTNFN